MIQLTQEQHELLSNTLSEPVRAVDPANNSEYVLIRADVYDRVKALFSNDEWADHVSAAAMEVFAREGWNDPQMDIYDSLDPRKPQ